MVIEILAGDLRCAPAMALARATDRDRTDHGAPSEDGRPRKWQLIGTRLARYLDLSPGAG